MKYNTNRSNFYCQKAARIVCATKKTNTAQKQRTEQNKIDCVRNTKSFDQFERRGTRCALGKIQARTISIACLRIMLYSFPMLPVRAFVLSVLSADEWSLCVVVFGAIVRLKCVLSAIHIGSHETAHTRKRLKSLFLHIVLTLCRILIHSHRNFRLNHGFVKHISLAGEQLHRPYNVNIRFVPGSNYANHICKQSISHIL